MDLDKILNLIEPAYENSLKAAMNRVNDLAKPPKSLGELENIAVKLAGITGKVNNSIDKKAVIIFSADNGVVEEGIASTPQYVTLSQTINFVKGKTGVAALAKENNTVLKVIDVGINSDYKIDGVIDKKIRKGTNNIRFGQAMCRKECLKAIEIGFESVRTCYNEGFSIIGVGEMGIGNTTTSSAVLMAITGVSAEEAVGMGAGLSMEGFQRKKKVINEALEINAPNKEDIIDIVSKVGGFDIGAMIGAYIGAAYYRIPIVIDGFISVVAALGASMLNENIRDFLIASHCSRERGYKIAIEKLNLKPMLNLDMALGEGSGCPIAFSVVGFACAMMNNMATFKEAEIDSSYLVKNILV